MRLAAFLVVFFSLAGSSHGCGLLKKILGRVSSPISCEPSKCVDGQCSEAPTEEAPPADQAVSGPDAFGFVSLLNQYRAMRGRAPVKYSRSLSEDAARNNKTSRPHGFMGRARVQNWARGYKDSASVLRAWRNSRGHDRNLLNSSITEVGIDFTDREWTFSGK